jgi:hypothetical protein
MMGMLELRLRGGTPVALGISKRRAIDGGPAPAARNRARAPE